jgi:excisionase family DNA binding protein
MCYDDDMESEQMMTTEQAAERLQVGVVTVQRWLRSGRLRGVRIGGRRAGWRIPANEVERLLRGEDNGGR